jgi:hypothetical protein
MSTYQEAVWRKLKMFQYQGMPIFVFFNISNVEKEAFTTVPVLSERFTNTPSHQYHQNLANLSEFSTYAREKLCASKDPQCLAKAAILDSADYLDIDYDSISQALVIKAYRHQSPGSDLAWTEELQQIGDSKTEIGILAPDIASDLESIKMGGYLVVLGEDDKPSKMLYLH